MTLLRDSVLDFAAQLEDPEELCADLVEAIEMATHDGDFSELEVLLEALESCTDLIKSVPPSSWRDFWSEEYGED